MAARILLVDSYDSFTYNLAALFRRSIPDCYIHIIKNDDLTFAQLLPYLSYFSAVVVGPGPGSPQSDTDIGIVKHLWHASDQHLLPIFGVCLGLQSMAVEFGATLKKLAVVKHGQVSRIEHEGIEIFKGVGEVDAVRYHSLHVELEQGGDIEALAWADDGKDENGYVLMAAKHRTKPFWAVQYHPESVWTRGGGQEVLSNFWRLSKNWTANHDRKLHAWDLDADRVFGHLWPQSTSVPRSPAPAYQVTASRLHLPTLSVPAICEQFHVSDERSPFVLLDSAARPGRFSIIGCLRPSSPRITYYADRPYVSLSRGKQTSQINLGSQDIWSWLSSFMRARAAHGGPSEIPFWGGLVGYLSYEIGVRELSIPLQRGTSDDEVRHPDVNLIFVDRSIVVDSWTGDVYVQSLLPADNWVPEAEEMLRASARTRSSHSATKPRPAFSRARVILPDEELYISRIKEAKEYLASGHSYELCLTAQTSVIIPKLEFIPSSWSLYKSLRATNPAPHGAYIRLHPTTLLSSSPERFLSFSRPPGTVCQLRPIKGTVRKAPGVTRVIAEQALAGSRKEVAENLMIVDLIRHDLHGVVGDAVQVKKFCGVEEYETVWQLVSVIEGASGEDADANRELGWEVLRRSLPPGSMTGAPKKRSVEILRNLEDGERGVYSGVCGYWDVGGGGDWSVIIRSCFKHEEGHSCGDEDPRHNSVGGEDVPEGVEKWTIGAGGAITALSDPRAEWDEMVVKLHSALRAFGMSPETDLKPSS